MRTETTPTIIGADRSFFALVSESHGTYRLAPGPNEVGRDGAAGVVIADSSISQRHAVLDVLETGVLVRDLASKNGTFVNDLLASSIEAKAGDEVRFGRFSYVLETLDPEDAWLAVRSPERARPAKRTGSAHSTVVTQTQASEIEAQQVRAFVDEITSATARGEYSAALAILNRELGTETAVVVEFEGHEPPRVLATSGSLDLTSRQLEEVSARGQEADSKKSFAIVKVAGTTYAVASQRGGDRRLVLVVSGTRPAHSAAGWVVSITLSVLALGLGSLTRIKSELEGAPALVFPENHLRCPSRRMAELYEELRSAVDSSLPVLVQGETGVGKESIAAILHGSSKRADGPLVAVNCAAIPSDLLEAELFGVATGAATGVSPRIGKFEAANGGTILLDEIGEMKGDLQVKLLRVLDQGSVEPVGGAPRQLDLRVVASTNRDLRKDVSDGRFRADLYYRLSGFVFEVPPLRSRTADVAALVEYFFLSASREVGNAVHGITYAALKNLTERDWPGNVRELRHAVYRAVHATPAGGVIDSKRIQQFGTLALEAAGDDGASYPLVGKLRLDELERAAIQEALSRFEGNRSAAARVLGISRGALRRRLAKHGLEGQD